MGIIILILVAVVGYFIFKSIKAAGNARVETDDQHYKQGHVEVIFAKGQIKIKDQVYDVNQVTGIKSEPYTSNGHGNSRAYRAIIEVDDLKRPRHSINFLSRKKAEEFTQRLCVALRKAGGPSFS